MPGGVLEREKDGVLRKKLAIGPDRVGRHYWPLVFYP